MSKAFGFVLAGLVASLAAAEAQAQGYVYVPNSYYVAPPQLVAPVFTAPVPVGVVSPVAYSTYYAPPVAYAPVPVAPVPVASLPVMTVPTFVAPVAPVYMAPAYPVYRPGYYSFRSYSGPFRTWTREVIRY